MVLQDYFYPFLFLTELCKCLWNKFIRVVLWGQGMCICNLAFQIAKMLSSALCQFTLIPVMYESTYFLKTWSNYIFQCFDLCHFDRWKIRIHGSLAFLMKYTEHFIIFLKENWISFSVTCPCSLPISPFDGLLIDL